jgi:UDP-glucose:(heptosyl)LPS alpha-1,3-glucosyltransferase
MKKKRALAFAIHHLNPWGGHDRSTLEIVKRISRKTPVEIHSFTLEDPLLAKGEDRGWGEFRFQPVRPHIRKPALFMLSVYYLVTGIRLRWIPAFLRRERPLIHSTGACSWVSDVIQVQFVQAAWQKKLRTLDPRFYRPPATRSGGWLKRAMRGAYHSLLLRYNLWVERRVYRKDKTYIAIAHCVAQELKDCFGILSDRIHVIHHGVDAEAFRPVDENTTAEREKIRSELGILPQERMIVFVGEYERKGLAASIHAIAEMDPTLRSKAKLVAIGGGDIKGFAALAESLGIAKHICLVGHQKNIDRFYRASDLFLLPTLYEPFGLVIIEAMASGLPMVISRLAGGAELIEDGVSGQLIDDPADPKGIARALEAVLVDDHLRQEMGKNARKAAVARSWDRVADEYWRVLEPML